MSLKIDGPLAGPISLTVTTTPVLAKVGVTQLDGGRGVIIQPIGGDVYFGFSNTVTISTGFKVLDGNIYRIDAESRFLTVYLVSAGSVPTRVLEFS
jgi:hypothetical protein